MNRLVLIGNGFDLAHDLKTRYKDFINWYWEQRVYEFRTSYDPIIKDPLCSISVLNDPTCFFYAYNHFSPMNESNKDRLQILRNDKDNIMFSYSIFFENIIKSIETKNWVDIENEYYALVKKYSKDYPSEDSMKKLNNQLHFLQEKLIEYLSTINQQDINQKKEVHNKIYAPIHPNEVSVEGGKELDFIDKRWKELKPDELNDLVGELLSRYRITNYLTKKDYIDEVKDYIEDPIHFKDYPRLFMMPDNIMLLNFNYTKTVSLYHNPNFILNYIHGKLDNPDSVIFGYGDELDEDYKKIQNLNDNEYLKNVKSIRYMESDNYRKVLQFIESAPYQICIMGHSCGNSDRTLLNTLFEHKNCISIKPYFYEKEDGTNNYLELVQNISRNFTDMKLMRDRVVNKTYCEPLVKSNV